MQMRKKMTSSEVSPIKPELENLAASGLLQLRDQQNVVASSSSEVASTDNKVVSTGNKRSFVFNGYSLVESSAPVFQRAPLLNKQPTVKLRITDKVLSEHGTNGIVEIGKLVRDNKKTEMNKSRKSFCKKR